MLAGHVRNPNVIVRSPDYYTPTLRCPVPIEPYNFEKGIELLEDMYFKYCHNANLDHPFRNIIKNMLSILLVHRENPCIDQFLAENPEVNTKWESVYGLVAHW